MRLTFFLILSPLVLLAQQSINTDQFFVLGLSTQGAPTQNSTSKNNMPWVETYDIRSESRDFEWRQQEYTVRLSPNSPGKRKAQMALYDYISNAPDFAWQEAYCDHLQEMYEDWIKLYFLQEQLQIIDLWQQTMNDKQVVYDRLAGSYDFDFKELVALEKDKTELTILKNDLELEQAQTKVKYGIENANLDFQNLLDVDQLRQQIASQELLATDYQDPENTYEQELNLRELELEKAESKQILDFVQLKYQGPHSDEWRERMSVGIGLRITDSGNRKVKLQELQLKQKELDRELQLDRQANQLDVNDLRQKLMMELESYVYFKSTIDKERQSLQNMANQISRKEGFDPLLLLEIEQRHLLNLQKELKRKEDVFSRYLSLIEQNGALCKTPFVNYLKP